MDSRATYTDRELSQRAASALERIADALEAICNKTQPISANSGGTGDGPPGGGG